MTDASELAIADRCLELRHDFTANAAAHIALAELLGCPLLTSGVELHGPHGALVEAVPR